MQIQTPDDVANKQLKIFTCEGLNVYSGTLIPLSTPIEISSENKLIRTYSSNSDEDDDEDEDEEILPPGRWVSYDELGPEDVSQIYNVEIEEAYSYNGIYCEKVIHEGTQFTVDLIIYNKSGYTRTFAWIENDPNNPESGIFLGSKIDVRPGEKITTSISFDSKYLGYYEDEDHQPEDVS